MTVHDGFGDQDWFDAWYDAFAPGVRRFSLPLTSQDFQPELDEGFGRLLRRPWRFLRAPVNAHTPRYGWKLTVLPSIDTLSDSLSEVLGSSRCHGIELGLLPEHGATAQLLGALSERSGWLVSFEKSERASLVDVDGHWDPYWQARSGNLRRALNKQERQLRQLGRVEFHDSAQTDQWHDPFEQGLALEATGWKGRGQTAILQRPHEARFYRRIAEAAAIKRKLRLFTLAVDGRMIAFYLAVAEADVLFWLKVAYDEQYSHYGPAMLLFRWGLSACFDDPSVRVVNVPGAPEWTLRWATRTEQLVDVKALPSCSVAGVGLRVETLARYCRHRLMPLNRGA